MKITLNNEPFDITLENEKSLNELFSGLSEWLNKFGYEIIDMEMDDSKLEIEKFSEWGNILLENIKILNINAISGPDRYISDLQTLYQYITLLKNAITANNTSLTTDLLLELPYVTSAMDTYLTKKDLQKYGILKLQELIANYQKGTGDKLEEKKLLLEILHEITIILQNRIQEVTSPFSELQNTAELLKDLIPSISDVAVLLQTGNDKKAMDSVLNFIDLSEKLIRIFPFLKEYGYTDISKVSINSESFNGFYKDLNDILVELVEAFNIKDSILIGDLMEYEIAPRITKLLEYINLIEKKDE